MFAIVHARQVSHCHLQICCCLDAQQMGRTQAQLTTNNWPPRLFAMQIHRASASLCMQRALSPCCCSRFPAPPPAQGPLAWCATPASSWSSAHRHRCGPQCTAPSQTRARSASRRAAAAQLSSTLPAHLPNHVATACIRVTAREGVLLHGAYDAGLWDGRSKVQATVCAAPGRHEVVHLHQQVVQPDMLALF